MKKTIFIFIAFMAMPLLFSSYSSNFATNKLIRGEVPRYDVKGLVLDDYDLTPIIGANLIIQGTTIGTTTDFMGKFILKNVVYGDVLEITCFGYLPQTIVVTGNMNLVIRLKQA